MQAQPDHNTRTLKQALRSVSPGVLALFLTLLAALLPGFPAWAAGAPTAIEVRINAVQAERGGRLLVALFADERGWGESSRALRTAVVTLDESSQQPVSVRFSGLPADDSYAVQVLHDTNGNGKLDMRWLPTPKPREGSGVSNNNERAGPPRYQQARFRVPTAGAVDIMMRYY